MVMRAGLYRRSAVASLANPETKEENEHRACRKPGAIMSSDEKVHQIRTLKFLIREIPHSANPQSNPACVM